MRDNPNMVDLPWHDGTTRVVPEWAAYQAVSGVMLVARDGGYSDGIDPNEPRNEPIHPHIGQTAAIRVFGELPEPPVKANVPTSLGAIVSSLKAYPNDPGYVLTLGGWRGLRTNNKYDPSEIDDELRRGAYVLYEGDDKKAAPEPPLPELPTNTGAIIAEFLGGKATYWSVRLDPDGKWRSEGLVFSEHELSQMLKDGSAMVVFEGEGTPAPESGE